MVEADMDIIAEAIAMMLQSPEENHDKALALVQSLTEKYPLS